MQELEVIKFELDFDKTLPYVKECLEGVTALSQWILDNIDLTKGRFFTYICESTDRETVYDFRSGVIFPPPDRRGGFSLKQSLSYYVFEYLNEKIDKNEVDFCALDDYKLYVDDEYVKELEKLNRIKFFKEEITHFLSKEIISKELFLDTLFEADAIWHCVGIAAQWKNKDPLIGSAFPIENIDTEGDIVLIIGAYDKESYIIWEKFK